MFVVIVVYDCNICSKVECGLPGKHQQQVQW